MGSQEMLHVLMAEKAFFGRNLNTGQLAAPHQVMNCAQSYTKQLGNSFWT
jgi:hypothetical protein